MRILQALIESRFAAALGWTLVHSLWEGAGAALLLAAVLLAVRSARIRYACACAASLAVVAGFWITFLVVLPHGPGGTGAGVDALHGMGRLRGATGDGAGRMTLAVLLPWLTPFWMAGALLFQLRSVASWMAVARLRRRGVCSAPKLWLERLDELRRRLKLERPVALLESGLARVPMVAGYLRPAILVPVGLLAGMPAGQVEAILLHELAHIRRQDYLVNLLQIVVEGFLFYHPAVWWISSIIRAERENCCDDVAVAASGDAHAYASALAALERSRSAAHQAAMAATGGSLLQRMHRLLYTPKRLEFGPLFPAGILTLAVAGMLAAWQASAPPPATRPADASISPYTRWLEEDVVYLADDRERAAFLRLTTDEERNQFIEQFWERRNPSPGSAQNEFKVEHYRRTGFANGRFAWHAVAGWKTDRGRMYILYGPPDEIESHPHGQEGVGQGTPGKPPNEAWMYHRLKGIGTNVMVEFDDVKSNGDFRMTLDPNPATGKPVQSP